MKVFTEGGVISDHTIGEGSVSLEGSHRCVHTTPIAWTRKSRQSGLENMSVGEVTGAVSVNAYRTPLFKELLQVSAGKRGAPL